LKSTDGKQYQSLVKDIELESQYTDKLNNFITESIAHQNSLTINNFDKKHKPFAEIIKTKMPTKEQIQEPNNNKVTITTNSNGDNINV